ncbi:MAG TPA: hypothetical protein VFQ39_20110 [Longimicrobium sp.]|nr:hypothetical protein [Longimicrobium sp.]
MQGPDPNRAWPDDTGWQPDEPGNERSGRMGLPTGAIVFIVVVIAVAFIVAVVF